MDVLLYVAGALLIAAGVAGLVLPVLPGPLLMLGGVVLVAWAGHFALVGPVTLGVAAVLAVLMLVVDHLAGLLGARAFGASRWALLGGALGVVVGLFLGPLGIVLGPPAGAVAFELWKGQDLRQAARSGVGVLVGFLAGSVAKVVLAFVMLGVVAVALVT